MRETQGRSFYKKIIKCSEFYSLTWKPNILFASLFQGMLWGDCMCKERGDLNLTSSGELVKSVSPEDHLTASLKSNRSWLLQKNFQSPMLPSVSDLPGEFPFLKSRRGTRYLTQSLSHQFYHCGDGIHL